MTRIKKKHRHRDHHGRGYIFMRVTVRKPDVHDGAEQRELCETISALLDLTSSALYLADLRGETISSWNAEEPGRGERFSALTRRDCFADVVLPAGNVTKRLNSSSTASSVGERAAA